MSKSLKSTGRRLLSFTGGVDASDPLTRAAARNKTGEKERVLSRPSHLVNMIRDPARKGGGYLETVPGFRALPKTFFNGDGKTIHGLYTAAFPDGATGERKDYLVIHRGKKLYVTPMATRDQPGNLLPVATLADAPSQAVFFRDCLILADGQKLFCLSSPTTCVVWGDSGGSLPSVNVTVPTAFLNGAPYEARNLLTRYYDQREELLDLKEDKSDYGLRVQAFTEGEETAWEVVGIDAQCTFAYVPDRLTVNGVTRPIRRIAPAAFKGSNITGAVLAPSVKEILGTTGANPNAGAFYSCPHLKFVMLTGVTYIGGDAFALCYQLERLVMADTVATVAPTAFYGTAALRQVYYQGTSWNQTVYPFGTDVKIYTNTHLGVGTVGEELTLPMDRQSYPECQVALGSETGAVEKITPYYGIYDEEEKTATGYRLTFGACAAAVGLVFPSSLGTLPDRYAFLTVFAPSETREMFTLNTKESPYRSFRFLLHDRCVRVASVHLNGQTVSAAANATLYYSTESVTDASGTFCRALILHGSRDELLDKTLTIRCYGAEGSYDPRPLPDYRSTATGGSGTGFSGSAADAVKHCRVLTVYDGRLFLSGNPALPDTVFFTARRADGGNGVGYFGTDCVFCSGIGRGRIRGLASCPGGLAVLKGGQGGGVFLHTPTARTAGGSIPAVCLPPDYREILGTHEEEATGAALAFENELLFLTPRGLCSLGSKNLLGERSVGRRSLPVDRVFTRDFLANAVMTLWNDRLLVSHGGEVWMADPDRPFTVEKEKQFEWYHLSGIGSYDGQMPRVRYATAFPRRADGVSLAGTFVQGLPLKLKPASSRPAGSETAGSGTDPYAPTGNVVSTAAVDEQGGTWGNVLAEITGDAAYLLEEGPEQVGGTFTPATAFVSLQEVLCFGTGEGKVFCFNNDRRGILPPPLAEAAPAGSFVLPLDEIHPWYYTFNGRAYPAGFVTAPDDGDEPHRRKRTLRRFLTLRSSCRPGSRFVLAVQYDEQPWQTVATVTSDSFRVEGMDLTSLSFSEGTELQQVLVESNAPVSDASETGGGCPPDDNISGTIARLFFGEEAPNEASASADIGGSGGSCDGGGRDEPWAGARRTERHYTVKRYAIFTEEFARPFGISSLAYDFQVTGHPHLP